MPAYYTYIIEAVDSKGNVSYYTGSTDNVLRRFREHASGRGARYLRGKQLRLVYREVHTSRSAAMRREYEIKQFSQQQKIELIGHV